MTAKVGDKARTVLDQHLKRIEAALGEEPDILVADSRYELIGRMTKETVKRTDRLGRSLSDKIDRVVLHRVWGITVPSATKTATSRP